MAGWGHDTAIIEGPISQSGFA